MFLATDRPLLAEASSVAALIAVPASIVAGTAMLGTITSIAEVAAVQTPVAGIESSTWTPLTGITSFLFGLGAFHGGFAVLSIAFGLTVFYAFALLFGVFGVALILATQGRECGVVGGVIEGIAYGLFLQVFFLALVVNGTQTQLTVYESAPRWSWWVAHAIFGAALGAMTSLLSGRKAVVA
jgi:hypothetical protein